MDYSNTSIHFKGDTNQHYPALKQKVNYLFILKCGVDKKHHSFINSMHGLIEKNLTLTEGQENYIESLYNNLRG